MRDRLGWRVWQHVQLWGLSVALPDAPARVRCPPCGITVEAVPRATGKSTLSEPLVVVLATWVRRLAWGVVAGLFGVSWGTVQAAVRRAVGFGLAHREVGSVLCIGIDEIADGIWAVYFYD